MPRPIKDGNNFEINRSIVYNGKDINFHMPSMSACIKHYEIGFQISGSHHVYSTDGEWDILRGYVGTMPLGLHHQTFCTRVVVAVTFEQVDDAPDTETGTERDNEGLKNGDCLFKKCHIVC